MERAAELGQRLDAARLANDPERARAIAWWAYEQGEAAGAHAWLCDGEFSRLDAGWRRGKGGVLGEGWVMVATDVSAETIQASAVQRLSVRKTWKRRLPVRGPQRRFEPMSENHPECDMARAVTEIEKDIRALSAEEKRELLRVLTAELDAGEDGAALAAEFAEAVERTSRAIDTTLDRLETFDEDLTRVRKEARESVLRSSERWPFPLA